MRISRKTSRVFLSSALTLAAAGGAALVPAPQAHAQGLNPLAPLRLKLGGYFADGDNGLMLGASYDFRSSRAAVAVPLVYSLYGDAVLGGDADFLGLGAQLRAYLTPGGVPGVPRFYAGAGLGFYFADSDDDDDDTGLGGKLFAGAEFGTNLFGQLGYHFVPGDRNGLELSLGFRF